VNANVLSCEHLVVRAADLWRPINQLTVRCESSSW
jgi:hypothetical protein